MRGETFTFVFDSYEEASFWFKEAYKRWEKEVFWSDSQLLIIEFVDSTYYFVSENQLKLQSHLKGSTMYGLKELYIILDHPRKILGITCEEIENVEI